MTKSLRFSCLLAAGLILGGCASTEDLTRLEPSFFGSTQRSADAYSQCIQAAWEGQGSSVTRTAIQDGYRVSASSSLSTEGVLDVISWRGKTDVKLYTRLPSRGRELIESANLCM